MEILDFKEKIRAIAQETTDTQIHWAGIDPHLNAQVSVELTIDEQKLTADKQQYVQEILAQNIKSKNEYLSQQKQYIEELAAAAKVRDDRAVREIEAAREARIAREAAARLAEQKALAQAEAARRAEAAKKGLTPSEQRVGLFNFDIEQAKPEEDPLKRGQPDEKQSPSAQDLMRYIEVPRVPPTLSISIAMPEEKLASEIKFTYDLAKYLTSLSISITSPHSLTPELETNIRRAIITALDLPLLKDKDTTRLIKFNVLEVEKEAPKWIQRFTNPENGRVWDLSSSLILGILLFFGTLMLTKGVGKIAAVLRELKPEKEEADLKTIEVEGKNVNASDAAEDGDRPKKSYDPASVQALTSEMKTIRDQLSELILENPNIAAELIRDLMYEPSGFSDFRDLLGFAGYTALKPAMDLLPRSNLDDLSSFIEDHQHDESSLLDGVEVAQRIYRSIISRFTDIDAVGKPGDLQKLKDLVIKVEDRTLNVLLKNLEAAEVALLINILSTERGNSLLKKLSQAQIKSACQFLDSRPEELAQSIKSLSLKIKDAATKESEQVSQKQRRFILRMARKATLGEEDFVKNLIPVEDWELKKKIMTSHFFFCDLIYVSPAFIRETMDSFKLNFRAEFLYLLSAELRSNIVATYTEGSRLRSMLEAELRELEQNAKRAEQINQTREILINEFMEKFRQRFTADLKQYKAVVLKQCKMHNLTPPVEMAQDLQESMRNPGSVAA